jgi:hypothetical protein
VTNLGAMTLNSAGISTTLTAGFSAGNFVGNISGAVGGYFGSYLANEIVPAHGIASSIGGRIGGFVASEIPIVGTFFGSLVGSVLGTLVGGLFDPHIVPWSQEMVGAVNGVLGINYWNWNGGGNPQEFTALANMVASNADQVLALTRRDPNIMNITGLTSINELVFNQLGSTLTAIPRRQPHRFLYRRHAASYRAAGFVQYERDRDLRARAARRACRQRSDRHRRVRGRARAGHDDAGSLCRSSRRAGLRALPRQCRGDQHGDGGQSRFRFHRGMEHNADARRRSASTASLLIPAGRRI